MQLDERLLAQIRSIPLPAVIAISGFGGSGKSSLAAQLGKRFEAPVVSVDSFIRDKHLRHYTQWSFIEVREDSGPRNKEISDNEHRDQKAIHPRI